MTQIDIFNAALAVLGHDQDVTALTDQTAVAIWCNRFWDQDRQELLRLLAPGFARCYADLGSPNIVTDNGQWGFAFNVSPGTLKVLSIKDSSGQTPIPFALYSGLVYCNQQSAMIEFVQDVPDPAQFEPLFTRALICKLACDVALPLTGQTSAKTEALKELQAVLADARNMDAQDARDVGQPADRNWWANCRGAKYNPGYGDAQGNYFPGSNR